MNRFLAIMIMLLPFVPVVAAAAVHKETVEYKQNGTVLEGYLAYDDSSKDKRPGVVLVPDWMGVHDHYKGIADKLVGLGYVAFVADIYGKGVRPTNTEQAAALANKYKSDRPAMRARALAALEALKKSPVVDPDKIVAIGYCFGGTTVLELARSGVPIKGVVSFHGGLGTPTPEDAKSIKAKVLVLHGADDPFVPPAEVAAFQEEMRKGGVDWQMVAYGDAVHSFTKQAAGSDKSKGNAYNEKADRRSWKAMKTFFKELFEPGTKK
jgi:dienelactone hydrolase